MEKISNTFSSDQEQDFNLRAELSKYFREWYLFLISIIIALSSVFIYLRFTPKVYEVSSVILIKDEEKGLGNGNDILKDLATFSGNKIVENEMEIFRARSLMKSVIESLRLNVLYYKEDSPFDNDLYGNSPIWIQVNNLTPNAFKQKIKIKIIDSQYFEVDVNGNNVGRFSFGESIAKSGIGNARVFLNRNKFKSREEIKVVFKELNQMIEDNLKKLDVSLLNQKSTVLKLSYQETLPERGKDIIKKLHEVYTLAALKDKNIEATNTLRFIDDRLRLITTELNDVEKDVESYKSTAGFTDISSEADLFLEKIKETDTKLNEVDIQIKILESVEKFLNTPGANLLALNSMVEDPILLNLIKNLSDLEIQKEKYAITLRSGNPLLEGVNSQILNARQAIKENISNQKKSLLVSKNSLSSLNRTIESSIKGIPKKEREFVAIKRQQGIKESLFLLLLKKKEETAISYASTVADSRLIDEAFVKPVPVSPKPLFIFTIALIIGLAFPIVIISIKSLLNDKVSSRTDLETKLGGLPILGEVSQKPKKLAGPLLDINSNHFIVEQFRILRTNIQFFINSQKRTQRILLTSSISGEGKSFVSLNLSASLASSGNKVLLINADIRKPKLHEYLNLPNDSGIVNYLIGSKTENDVIQKTPLENLHFVSSGPIPPNPAELISNGNFKKFVEIVESKYDFVIIDCSPSGLVTDALLIAPFCDATVFLVRHNYTPKIALNALVNLYKEQKMPSLTVVYNGLDSSAGYGYGYGYGYYGDSAKDK